jgi:hypothetical protein
MRTILVCIASVICMSSVSMAQWTARTSEDPFGGGTTTRFDDGSTAHTTRDPFGGGSTIRFDD